MAIQPSEQTTVPITASSGSSTDRRSPIGQRTRTENGVRYGTLAVGLAVAHLDDRGVGDRERQHRAERVGADEEA